MPRSTPFHAVAATALLLASAVSAYVPQTASSFGGAVLNVAPSTSSAPRGRGDLSMKKGKPNVPPQMRANYRAQQAQSSERESMMAASRMGEDGLPVFNLFVRTPTANMWYPCGSFKGDDRSAGLASNYKDDGFLAGISKKQLDAGVSGSLFRDIEQLKESVCRGYPQLRKQRTKLEFGYKLAYDGLSEEQQKISVVEPKEQKGVFDGIKSMFG